MMARNKGRRLENYVKDYIVFDLETTGINPSKDSIIEISAVRVRDGEIVLEYSTLVNPECHIPAAATAVNGITDSMVAGAPLIGEAIKGFTEFIESDILVGHNIHTFDTNFVYDAAWLNLGCEIRNDYIDTLYMARRRLPKLKHHKLTDISEYFEIATAGAHRALNDCIMNQKCFEMLGRILPEKEEAEEVCPQCGSILYKRKGKFGMFYGCGGYPVCRYTRNIKEEM